MQILNQQHKHNNKLIHNPIKRAAMELWQPTAITGLNTDDVIERFLRKRGFPISAHNIHLFEVPIPRKRPRREAPQVLRFSDEHEIRLVSYADDDILNSWYQRTDYYGFSRECRSVLRETDAVKGDISKIDASKYCVRGLECHIIPSLNTVKQERRRVHIKLIIQQYQKQKRLNGSSIDCEGLRALSSVLSRRSRGLARELGALDQSYK